MKATVFAILVLALAGHAQQPPQTFGQQPAAMMHRRDQGMGFSQQNTTHHFILQKSGGEIQVTVKDPNDSANLEHIRMHLSHIAKMFSAGNFEIPMFVHDTTPPGVSVMKKLHAQIRYGYAEIENGGKVTIATENRKALEAIHKFLRFQITEHQTGDSMDVRK